MRRFWEPHAKARSDSQRKANIPHSIQNTPFYKRENPIGRIAVTAGKRLIIPIAQLMATALGYVSRADSQIYRSADEICLLRLFMCAMGDLAGIVSFVK